MTDDFWAARAADVDWSLLAGKRPMFGFAMAPVVGVVLLSGGHALIHWRLESSLARPPRTASIGALVVAAASAAGAIQFARTAVVLMSDN